MSRQLEFETPENILVRYKPAGLGGRYLAWVIDSLVSTLVLAVIVFIVLVILLSSTAIQASFDSLFGEQGSGSLEELYIYVVVILFLFMGFFNFLFFASMEWFMGGRTLGKKVMSLRVVKASGFSLDIASILLRNLFRVIDSLHIFWLVPVFSSKSQRFGDMAAGTLVIKDKVMRLNPIREHLSRVGLDACAFRFDQSRLAMLSLEEYEKLERIMERVGRLHVIQQDAIVSKTSRAIAARLQMDPPERGNRKRFLMDLLIGEYNRRISRLG